MNKNLTKQIVVSTQKLLHMIDEKYPDAFATTPFVTLELFTDESGSIAQGEKNLFEFSSIQELAEHLQEKES